MKVSIFAPIAQLNAARPAAEGDNPTASPTGNWPTPVANYSKHAGQEGFKIAVEEVQAAEDLGFDMVTFSEHHYGFGGLTPITTVPAASMAAYTKKIKLGIMGPVLAINNPVRTAEEIAIVDNISEGRVVVGMLRGTPNEYQVYGVNPSETREIAAESMALILKCWSEPQPFSWEGKHFQFRTVSVWPQPVQDPYPKTYVLGYHHESIETAARNHLGIGVSFHLPDVFEPALAYYRERCAYYGWTPTPEHVIYRGRVHVAESDQQAEDELLAAMPRGRVAADGRNPEGTSVSRAVWKANPTGISGPDMKAYWAGKSKEEGTKSGNPADGMPRANFYGSPDSVLKHLREYSDALGGVGVFDLMFNSGMGNNNPKATLDRMELFAKEVIPGLREFN